MLASNRAVSRLLLLVLAAPLAALGACKHQDLAAQVQDDAPAAGDGAVAGFTPKVGEVLLEVNNDASFQRKLAVVRAAKTSLDIMYFIFQDDFTANVFLTELLERAKQGVRVRLIVDGNGFNFATVAKLSALKRAAMDAGVGANLDVAIFRPVDLGPDLNALVEAASLLKFQESTGEINYSALLNPLLQKLFPDAVGLDEASQVSLLEAALLKDASSFLALVARGQLTKEAILQQVLATATGHGVSAAAVTSIMELAKRAHHKLIVADGQVIVGGGRNMWDISNMNHAQALRPGKKTDTDVDYFATDAGLAAAATATFQRYWDCASGSCTAGITAQLVSPAAPADAPALWAAVVKAAKAYNERDPGQGDYPVLYSGTIVATDVPVTYVENRMFKLPDGQPGTDGRAEEDSGFLAAWARLLAQAQPGDQVILQSAYLILPTETLTAVLGAIKNDVKLTFLSNGANISDNKMTAMLTRMQMEALMGLAQKLGKAANVTYIENRSGEQMHTKVSVIGSTLIVGSSNADPRSAYLNTENGLVIGAGGAVTVAGQTYGSAAEAYRHFLLDAIDRYSQKQVADLNGDLHNVFERVSLADVTALLNQPPSGTNASAVAIKTRLFRLLRVLFATSVQDSAAGALQRRTLYEELLPQF